MLLRSVFDFVGLKRFFFCSFQPYSVKTCWALQKCCPNFIVFYLKAAVRDDWSSLRSVLTNIFKYIFSLIKWKSWKKKAKCYTTKIDLWHHKERFFFRLTTNFTHFRHFIRYFIMNIETFLSNDESWWIFESFTFVCYWISTKYRLKWWQIWYAYRLFINSEKETDILEGEDLTGWNLTHI